MVAATDNGSHNNSSSSLLLFPAAVAATPPHQPQPNTADIAAAAAVALAAVVQVSTSTGAAEAASAPAGTTTTAQRAPSPLPTGWILKESRSHPSYYYYYYHQDTGVSSWQPPHVELQTPKASAADGTTDPRPTTSSSELSPAAWMAREHQQQQQQQPPTKRQRLTEDDERMDPGVPPLPVATSSSSSSASKSGVHEEHQRRHSAVPTTTASLKRSKNANDDTGDASQAAADTLQRQHPDPPSATASKRTKPGKVRVLHILKKHAESRKPSSWRVPVITATKAEAIEELSGLLELLREVQSDPAELRATMEELARTESDCSSSKRGGDLGFFVPKKMQPAFEESAFGLEIGELSGIVETSSGIHVLLRIG